MCKDPLGSLSHCNSSLLSSKLLSVCAHVHIHTYTLVSSFFLFTIMLSWFPFLSTFSFPLPWHYCLCFKEVTKNKVRRRKVTENWGGIVPVVMSTSQESQPKNNCHMGRKAMNGRVLKWIYFLTFRFFSNKKKTPAVTEWGEVLPCVYWTTFTSCVNMNTLEWSSEPDPLEELDLRCLRPSSIMKASSMLI